MPLDAIHFAAGLVTGGGVAIGQVNDLSPQNEFDAIANYSGGSPFSSFTSYLNQRTDISLRSKKIATLLGLLGATGIDTSAGVMNLYYRRALNRQTPGAIGAASHRVIQVPSSLFYWTSIEASQGQEANIDCTISPVSSDGVQGPVILGGSLVTIPASLSVANEKFTLGPVFVNNVRLTGVVGVSISNAPSINPISEDGLSFNTAVFYQRCRTVITVRLERAQTWWDFGINPAQAANCRVFFRRMQNGTTPYADGSAQHLRLTPSLPSTLVGGLSAGEDQARPTLTINCDSADGEVAPLTIASNVTIA